MNIDIRHMETMKEGTLIYVLVPNAVRPLAPHHAVGDTDEVREKNRVIWNEALKAFDANDIEVRRLHLGKADLKQDGD